VADTLLPMIQVRNQIIYMLSGEISKMYTWKNKELIRTQCKGVFLLCTIHWYNVQVWTLRLLVVSYDCVYYVERGGHALSSGYGHIAALTSWELCTLCSVSIHQGESCLCMRRLETALLAQA